MSRAAKHTPGPWAQYAAVKLVIVDGKGSSLGDMVPGDPYISQEEALANAAMAAAAPEMYEALKDTVRMLEAVRYTAGLGKRQMERLEAAKAAIAKAEARP